MIEINLKTNPCFLRQTVASYKFLFTSKPAKGKFATYQFLSSITFFTSFGINSSLIYCASARCLPKFVKSVESVSVTFVVEFCLEYAHAKTSKLYMQRFITN